MRQVFSLDFWDATVPRYTSVELLNKCIEMTQLDREHWIAIAMGNVAEASQNAYLESAFQQFDWS
jgi:hypothetical protein